MSMRMSLHMSIHMSVRMCLAGLERVREAALLSWAVPTARHAISPAENRTLARLCSLACRHVYSPVYGHAHRHMHGQVHGQAYTHEHQHAYKACAWTCTGAYEHANRDLRRTWEQTVRIDSGTGMRPLQQGSRSVVRSKIVVCHKRGRYSTNVVVRHAPWLWEACVATELYPGLWPVTILWPHRPPRATGHA